MASKWDAITKWWRLDDDELPLTDPASAEDSVVEDLLIRYQKLSKELTDKLAQLSAIRTAKDESLRKMRDAVILAYGAALNGQLEQVKRYLEEVIDA